VARRPRAVGFPDRHAGGDPPPGQSTCATAYRFGVETALSLLRATGHADPEGPWLPVGAGVHTGVAWVGAVGDGSHTELTAVGDTVNVTSRLASPAEAGQVLVTADAAAAAGLDPGLERRSLQLTGKQAPTDVVILTVRS
jgi:adenylate cyclase